MNKTAKIALIVGGVVVVGGGLILLTKKKKQQDSNLGNTGATVPTNATTPINGNTNGQKNSSDTLKKVGIATAIAGAGLFLSSLIRKKEEKKTVAPSPLSSGALNIGPGGA